MERGGMNSSVHREEMCGTQRRRKMRKNGDSPVQADKTEGPLWRPEARAQSTLWSAHSIAIEMDFYATRQVDVLVTGRGFKRRVADSSGAWTRTPDCSKNRREDFDR